MRKIAVLIVIGMTIFGISSCSPSNSTSSSTSTSPTSPTSPNASPVVGQTDSRNQPVVKFGGSSATVKILNLLVKAYQAKNPTVKMESITDSQSSGAIAALNSNLIDIAGTTKKLKPEENNGKIQYRELARDLLLVATHSSVQGVTNLTTEQLKAIYKGEITNWKELGGPNAAIVVLDRPEDESAKRLLREYYLGNDKTTDKAILLNKEGELIDTLQSTPYAIGAFSLARSVSDRLPVNHLSLNGTAPNEKNFLAGQYQMVRHIGIVWHKKPTPATQKFIDFIFSPEGAQLLQNQGFISAQ